MDKSLMTILPEFPIEKELDLENIFIRIDNTSEHITYKLRLSTLINVIEKEISKKQK